MKRSIYIILFLLFAFPAAGFGRATGNKIKSESKAVPKDSVEYELIITDPGFETWFLTQPDRMYHSEAFYEFYNREFVNEWNYRYETGSTRGDYDCYIDYDPTIDYGIKLNYELYYYFRYFEQKYHTTLYPSFP
jgi:hypothetical protein